MTPNLKAFLVLAPLSVAIVVTAFGHRLNALVVVLLVAAWVTAKLEADRK